jgi:ketosteroid isomerase-like protein
MDKAEMLQAIEDNTQLKARYFRFIDTKDYEGLAGLFAEDASFDMRNARRNGNDERSLSEMAGKDAFPVGREAIVALIAGRTRTASTVHHGHMPEIEILSDTTARGIIAMEDSNSYVENGKTSKLHGFGHYHETYSKIGGRWYIQTLLLTRLRVDLS